MIVRTLLAFALAFAAADQAAVKETEQFRARHEADYRRDYATLAGLFALKDGVNTIGSAPSNAIVLPKPAPPQAGRLLVTAGRIRFEPMPGAVVTLRAQRVATAIDLASDEKGPPDELAIGGVSLWVHMSGDRRTVRVRDVNGAPAKAFAGFHWFPIDAKYRVAGRFIKDAARTTADSEPARRRGDTRRKGSSKFTIDGRKVTLRPMTTRPGRLYFIFRDGTSGKETYETARFLYADLKPDGTTVLDFNQAYNPPCSFNPYTTCPLPPKENRLTVRIPAGEKAYPHPPSHTNP